MSGHEHEAWQLRDSASGGTYCAACGAAVAGLRIFEKHPDTDAYRFGPSFTPHAIVAVEKRFTDSELAAEFHFARLDSRVRGARQQYSPSDVNWHHYLKGLDQEAAFERFATLPHFDEVSP